MLFRRLFAVLMFSLMAACGQQGPLYMPIEDTPSAPGEKS